MIAYLPNLDEETLETAYLNGLKPEIKVEIPKYRPFGLQQIMDVSLEVEASLQIIWETWPNNIRQALSRQSTEARQRPAVPRTFHTTTVPAAHITQGLSHSKDTTSIPAKPASTENFTRPPRKKIMRLTDEEFQLRREKGLYFHCNEKYTLGHRCKREINIFLVQEGDTNEDIPCSEEDIMEVDDDPVLPGSICAVRLGSSANGAIKVWGEFLGLSIIILIDGGASYNVIHSRLVQARSIPIEGNMRWDLIMADCSIRRAEGLCLDLPIVIQGLGFHQDFIPFNLGNIDMILGIQWLKSLG